ncbi:SLC13 family permease [Gordonia hydrophobica]|uniref:SLC13 family permease n=1 Tax=Gordonia hydrophobica TaxID=40516 RepID=UPI000825CA49
MTAALGGATLVAIVALFWVFPPDAHRLTLRMAPILLFVAAMSIVVNIAADAGAFDSVAEWIRNRVPPRMSPLIGAWCAVVLLSTVSTVFLSLDTTAILVTPLAVALAQRTGASVWASALTVVWIANLGSLLLPVSNLTNLLAATSGVFSGPAEYTAAAWLPALVATSIAVVAAVLVYWLRNHGTLSASAPGPRLPSGPRLRISLITLGAVLPLLASPVPYWATASVAAAVLLIVARPNMPSWMSMIPWRSLSLVTLLSALTTFVHATGATSDLAAYISSGQSSTAGLLMIASSGALAANLINNIPAYLILEVGIDSADGMLALLIGVNAGPVITPWASLATLLWRDQLRRNDIAVPWASYIGIGCVLAPLVICAAVFTI